MIAYSKSKIFAVAWRFAREGAARFGGSVRSYFAASLTRAYAEAKARDRDVRVMIAGRRVATTDKATALYMVAMPFRRGVIAEADCAKIATYRSYRHFNSAEAGEVTRLFNKYVVPYYG